MAACKVLRPKEFELLQYLCAHRYEECAREDILIAVWNLPAANMRQLPLAFYCVESVVSDCFDTANGNIVVPK